jgi:hypothetical protein
MMPSMRIELISEDIYSFAEVIREYETSVLTVKLRGRIRACKARFVETRSRRTIMTLRNVAGTAVISHLD